MPKKSEKSKKAKRNKQTETLTDKQKYEAILQEKDARIKELELELIIAKKVAARYPIDKRQKNMLPKNGNMFFLICLFS